MEDFGAVLRADTKNHYANVAISTGKFALSAAAAWAILSKMPHREDAAVISATVSTLFVMPIQDRDGNLDCGFLGRTHMKVGLGLHDKGLWSVLAGVQAASLLASLGANSRLWWVPPIGAGRADPRRTDPLITYCMITFSLLNLLVIKGGMALEDFKNSKKRSSAQG
jgi:hypothetical protein